MLSSLTQRIAGHLFASDLINFVLMLWMHASAARWSVSTSLLASDGMSLSLRFQKYGTLMEMSPLVGILLSLPKRGRALTLRPQTAGRSWWVMLLCLHTR